MYKLYFFEPERLHIDGYLFVDSFESEQDCNNMAYLSGKNFFRIELQRQEGPSLIYESPLELSAIGVLETQ